MESLIDSSIWIDSLRPATPERTRRVAADAVNRPNAVICDPTCSSARFACSTPPF